MTAYFLASKTAVNVSHRHVFWSVRWSISNEVHEEFRDDPYITSYILEGCLTPIPPYCHQPSYFGIPPPLYYHHIVIF